MYFILVTVVALVGSIFSLLIATLLLYKKIPMKFVSIFAVPLAAGALLAASFLDVLPEALEKAPADQILVTVLAGFLIFFLLEHVLGWFHHHHEHREEAHKSFLPHPGAGLVIIGDTLHNFIDGLVIGAAFLVDPMTGLIAALAVALHEIPQEVGDFGLLLSYGLRRRSVLAVNVLSAVTTIVGAWLVVLNAGALEGMEGYLLALAAGFFIYIAAADIIPTIHAEEKPSLRHIQVAVLIISVIAVGGLINISHEYLHGLEAEQAEEE